MSVLEPVPPPVAPRAPRRLPEVYGATWYVLSVLVAVLTAWLTMQSIQLGATLALVILTVGAYVRNRTAGLVVVWAVWLVTPFVRRIFLLSEPIQAAEPLALAPYLVTAAVICLELTQVELSRRARRLMLFAGAGYGIGLYAGINAPKAAAFGLFAYGTALGCFVIGYREADHRTLILPAVLMVAAPALAVYGFVQYFLPLPEWDRIWQLTADINSVGSPESGRVRIWSTLNSPGTLALVLGAAALALLISRRPNPIRLAAAAAVFGALALTYVRSAWVGVVLATLAVLVVTRGSALKRVGVTLAILAVAAPFVFGGSTGAALGDRLGTFGSLNQDTSAQERVDDRGGLFLPGLTNPIGLGLGRAGEASRLSGGPTFRYTDNGFLSLLLQVGPLGFLLVLYSFFGPLGDAWRNAWARKNSPGQARYDAMDVMIFSLLAFIVAMMFFGDVLFGIGGMIFWYASGVAIRRRELSGRARA